MSRTRRATWTYGTNVIFTVVTMFTGLFASPLITKWIGGPAPYGYYQAALALGGFVLLLELGLGGGMMALLSRAVGRGDQAEIRQTLAAGIRLSGKVCLLMVAAGLGVALGMPYLGRLGLEPIDPRYLRSVQVGFVLFSLGFLMVPFQPFRALMEARQRGYFINLLVISQTLLITGLSLGFAYSGLGIAGMFLATLLGTLVVPVILAAQGLASYPGVIREAVTRPAPAALRRSLWDQNRASMILNVCGRLSLYTDSLYLVTMMGGASVASVAFTSALAGMAKNQLLAVGSAVWAGLAEIRLRGDHGLFEKRFLEINRVLAVLGLTVLLPIAAYTRDFTGLWMREFPVYAGDGVLLVAVANALLLPFASLWGWVFQGQGRTPRLVGMTIVSTVLNVGISVAATRQLGMVGPLLGTLLSLVLYQLWMIPRLLWEEFRISPRRLTLAIVPSMVLGVPIGLVIWWFSRRWPASDWFGLILRMGMASLVYPILAWFLVLDREERALWTDRARPLLGRFLPVPDAPPVGPLDSSPDGGIPEVEGTEVAGPGPGRVD